MNLHVLRPLTRRPQGHPSPLWHPHGRPGVEGIFPTSRGQAPHGWPMVHDSMATGFPIPWGCCSALSVTHRALVRNPAMSSSPLPHPATGTRHIVSHLVLYTLYMADSQPELTDVGAPSLWFCFFRRGTLLKRFPQALGHRARR